MCRPGRFPFCWDSVGAVSFFVCSCVAGVCWWRVGLLFVFVVVGGCMGFLMWEGLCCEDCG